MIDMNAPNLPPQLPSNDDAMRRACADFALGQCPATCKTILDAILAGQAGD